MEHLDHLAQPLTGPVTADAIEAAVQADLRAITAPGGTARPVARPSVLTLIAVALDPSGTRRIFDAIDHLARQHPSRTIVLLPDYPAGVEDLQVWHNPVCYGSSPEGALVCGDSIIVAARGHAVHHLASLADQLQLPGLPVFLWWDADLAPAYEDLFARLTDLAGHLIVDSSAFRALGAATERLASLARRRHNPCFPGDLNWARLGPWREVLAQLFDLPAARPDLHAVGRLGVAYNPADSAGPAQALLFVAWLAGRLGWLPEPGPRVDLPGAPGQSLPSRLRRQGGFVALDVGERKTSERGLAEVELASVGGAAVRVARSEDCLDAVVESGSAGAHPVLHRVGFEELSPSALLGSELMIYGRDRAYEDTLAAAAVLVRGAEADAAGEKVERLSREGS